jgi:predicted AAA+ superfamily ATPase
MARKSTMMDYDLGMTSLVRRHLAPVVRESVDHFRIVEIQGARQSGKTTLAQQITTERGGRLVSLDDPLLRAAAADDPRTFVEQFPEGLLVIDELQRIPELVLALKLAVDRDPRPGRFLVTGSANLLRLPAVQDSLAGRAVGVELHGFSQGELCGHVERFIDRAFTGDRFLDHRSTRTKTDYLEAITAGSYPEAVALTAGRNRDRWFDGYLSRIVERDAPEIADGQRLADLPFVLRMIAARNADELNIADIAKESGIPSSTLTRLIGLLETLYLIQRVPAWETNLTKRVVRRPKVMLLDTGLASRLVNATTASLGPGVAGAPVGHLFEAFVATELRRQREWSDARPTISHYRVHQAEEVDLVLEAGDGRVVGIEVKASAMVNGHDARHLATLRDKLGNRFVGGILLHTGRTAAPFGDRITAAPMDILWTA